MPWWFPRAGDDALAILDRVAAPAIAVVAVLALAFEAYAPLRHRTTRRLRRYPANAIVGALGALTGRLAVLPAMVLVAAPWMRRGLLGQVHMPAWMHAAVAFVLLDYVFFWWHRANHRIAFLWRFHAVHHVDPDLDVTTAFRFHFGELMLSIPVIGVFVAALGVTPREIVIYEGALQLAATFHHANMRLPEWLERSLSNVIITPTLHGTHHSDQAEHLSSNWGVVLSVWDRLHGSRRIAAQDGIRIGIPSQPPVDEATGPVHVLLLPMRKAPPLA
ncbi:putative sterol desaturase [Labilithrix luteola]|uniref:Putative sterol desaturase n=1 Tax=Labilithrix luteola TaxID=1391654 RepID=A0A0K1QFA5_9BACT|nr:sterol desaturase family protein [Labilithrix luteola]AKV04456.1 putative sterol desaturase [Labilithrix luteola]